MSLTPPPKVGKLQAALHGKAKESPGYRLYALYDKLYRADVLRYAYDRCRRNGGAAGVDRQTFADIEAYGVDRWLAGLADELRGKAYRPQAVRRVWIPKADGSRRPPGVPTIRDRVVQMAALVVLEPIFEADLPPEQHAYRPGEGPLGAVRAVQGLLDDGYTDVVDADLSGYLDTIPHAELMKSVARRVSDRHLLGLVKAWLEAAVEERDEHGSWQRTTRNEDEGRGTPRGGVLSPLLANLDMRRFLLGWRAPGHEGRLEARVVDYADDFVICTRGRADAAMAAMRAMMARLKLTVDDRETRCCRLPDETFTFLGYTFGPCYSRRTGRAYLSPRPADAKLRALCAKLSDLTDRRTTSRDAEEVVGGLNRLLRGWANYFRLGPVAHAYEVVTEHARRGLRRWLCRKHEVRRRQYGRFPDEFLHGRLGLVDLTECRRRGSLWATP